MFRLVNLKRLGPVTVVAFVLVGDTVSAQWSDISDGFARERPEASDEGLGISNLMADGDPFADDILGTDSHRERNFKGRGGARSGVDRSQSSDDLLTALNQEHGLEVRLKIVRQLVGKVDVSLNAPLVAHLKRIRAEAAAAGNEDLANRAVQLIGSLELFENERRVRHIGRPGR